MAEATVLKKWKILCGNHAEAFPGTETARWQVDKDARLQSRPDCFQPFSVLLYATRQFPRKATLQIVRNRAANPENHETIQRPEPEDDGQERAPRAGPQGVGFGEKEDS